MKRQGVSDTDYHHMSKPGPDFNYFGDYVKQLKSGHVYDRFHYGGFVYGLMLGLHETQDYNLARLRLVSRFIHAAGGLIVLMCDGDHRSYKNRIKGSRKEMFAPGPILESNYIFPWLASLDDPNWIFDVRGGQHWPTTQHASHIVLAWRQRNGM